MFINFSPINYSKIQTRKQQIQRVNIPIIRDSISFKGNTIEIGQCPKDLQEIDFSKINNTSEGVLETNDIGYLAEIFKFSPKRSKKSYAVKRVWAADKVKHQTADPIAQMKIEAEIYEKINGFKNIPKFYYYNGDFDNNEKSLLKNYMIISWVEGKQASKNSVTYDLDMITNKKIDKIYKLLGKLDNIGVIHGDLWSGNILFSKNKVNIIDFNRSHMFNPLENLEENNLGSFKDRFLNCYFSDLFKKKGESAYIDVFKKVLKSEINYYKDKKHFYSKNKIKDGIKICDDKIKEINNILADSKKLKETAIKTIFNSDIRCAEIFSKYFEFDNEQALYQFKTALNTMKKYPEILGNEKIDLLKSNIIVVSCLDKFLKLNSATNKLKGMQYIDKALTLLNNSQIYNKTEKSKEYYTKYIRFCEFHKQYEAKQDINNIFEKYNDLMKVKLLKPHFNNLKQNIRNEE